jgi:hypothetical protein
MERKKLTDILRNGNGSDIRSLWDKTEAAGELTPLPAGEYTAHVVSGYLFTSKEKGTPGYKLGFRVLEGEHAGRMFWDDVWLTPAALPMAKRDLGKLGVTSLEQLERPLPPGIRARVKVALRKDDTGAEFNRVRSFDVVGIDTPAADAFAPTDQDTGTAGTGQGEGDASEPPPGAPADASFDVAALESPKSEGVLS